MIVNFLFFDEKKTSYWEESPGYPVKLIDATVILYLSKNAYLDTRKRFLTLLKPKIWLQPQLIATLNFSSKMMMDHIVVSKLTQKSCSWHEKQSYQKKKPRNYASASTPCSTKPSRGNHNTLKRSRTSPGDLPTKESKNQRHEDENVAGNNLLAG